MDDNGGIIPIIKTMKNHPYSYYIYSIYNTNAEKNCTIVYRKNLSRTKPL